MTDSATTVHVYCDGACSPNPGRGGWGAVIRSGGRDREIAGAERETTNNRMELTAAVAALRSLPEHSRVVVVTDSKYLADCFRQGWMDKWRKNGWQTAARAPVKNKDLWVILDEQVRRHTVTWQWIGGHTGHPENERADQLAVTARMRLP
ncbi:MAG: ribonuclease HI [Planctomycetota bacterium]